MMTHSEAMGYLSSLTVLSSLRRFSEAVYPYSTVGAVIYLDMDGSGTVNSPDLHEKLRFNDLAQAVVEMDRMAQQYRQNQINYELNRYYWVARKENYLIMDTNYDRRITTATLMQADQLTKELNS